MKTHKIKGEGHYQCREVKAERDALKAEIERLRAQLNTIQSILDKYGENSWDLLAWEIYHALEEI